MNNLRKICVCNCLCSPTSKRLTPDTKRTLFQKPEPRRSSVPSTSQQLSIQSTPQQSLAPEEYLHQTFALLDLLQEATDELRATVDEVLLAHEESEFLEFDETPDTIKLSTRNYEFEKGMVYHNFKAKHTFLADSCWCSFADFKQFVFYYQSLDFSVVENRDRVREACVKLRCSAPFSLTKRFPDEFFMFFEGVFYKHFEQLMGAVDLPDTAFGHSSVEPMHGITNTTDEKQSFDVAFQRFATIVSESDVKKLQSHGIYCRDSFEKRFNLEWWDP